MKRIIRRHRALILIEQSVQFLDKVCRVRLEKTEAIRRGVPPSQVAQILVEQLIQLLNWVGHVRLERTSTVGQGVPLYGGAGVHVHSNRRTEGCGEDMFMMGSFYLDLEKGGYIS